MYKKLLELFKEEFPDEDEYKIYQVAMNVEAFIKAELQHEKLRIIKEIVQAE